MFHYDSFGCDRRIEGGERPLTAKNGSDGIWLPNEIEFSGERSESAATSG
jgi:hypothetical protein